jgi:hypothetical protein
VRPRGDISRGDARALPRGDVGLFSMWLRRVLIDSISIVCTVVNDRDDAMIVDRRCDRATTANDQNDAWQHSRLTK